MAWKRSSLADVARRAGVSTATVSRTLSKPEVVSQSTRDAVLAAVSATGYSMNQTARNLRRKRTDCVVALIPNLANPFFSQILSGISAELALAGYNLLIGDTRGGPEVETLTLRYLDRGQADGLILLDGLIPRDHLDNETRAHPLPPSVCACEWIDGAPLPRVRIDNERGARLAVEHLLALGHRRIGYLSGPEDNVLTQTRAAGYRTAMAAAGIDVASGWLFGGDFSIASGARAGDAWLEMDAPPSAMFCASDAMAAGFAGSLRRAGRSVPGDCSIVGFDDIEVAAHTVPALTTIRQPRTEIGRVAARMVLELIGGRPVPEPDCVLPVELVVRDSTTAPAA